MYSTKEAKEELRKFATQKLEYNKIINGYIKKIHNILSAEDFHKSITIWFYLEDGSKYNLGTLGYKLKKCWIKILALHDDIEIYV